MMLRWDPFRELDRLTEQTWGNGQRAPRAVPIDAYRRGEQFFIHLDLPGVRPDDVELTVEKNVVTVRAERPWSGQEGDEVIVAERPRGTFTRQLFLGDNLDAGRVQASYDSGVLTLTVPVAEAAKPRRIEISGGEGASTPIDATSSAA